VKEGTIPANPTPDADARIIGAARQPLEPSAPRTGLIITLGGVVGLMSGLIATAVAEGFNRKIRTAQELTRDTELPCLALVPSESNWNGLSRRSDAEMDCLVVTHPASRFALAVRDMRTSIEIACSTLRMDKNLVVALVAWERDSGATLLSMNLAHLISRGGKHVTVFNSEENDTAGDMATYERPAPDSLVDALASNISPDQMTFSELDGISILRLHSSHVEMNHFANLSDPRVARIVEFARGRGQVLLDLPPLSESADALALAQHADAVVLIVAAGRTSADEVNDAMRSLRRVGANVVGAVLNRATA
jgi:succinoglycan biosynthesis transport protein ExoP